MADKRRFAVRFDDEAWNEDLSHATPGGAGGSWQRPASAGSEGNRRRRAEGL
jgi:hypothetical protein